MPPEDETSDAVGFNKLRYWTVKTIARCDAIEQSRQTWCLLAAATEASAMEEGLPDEIEKTLKRAREARTAMDEMFQGMERIETKKIPS
jgi:hypothetical protein